MEKYIPKSALVAEIEKAIKSIYAGREYVGIPSNEENIVRGLQKAEDIIGTLEVKEVDIDKLCEFRKNIGFAYPEGASEYQKQLACYRQGIKDAIKAQKGE